MSNENPTKAAERAWVYSADRNGWSRAEAESGPLRVGRAQSHAFLVFDTAQNDGRILDIFRARSRCNEVIPLLSLINLQWRQFPFFDVEPVKDVHDLAESPHILRVATSISTITSSEYGVVAADMYGSVHVLNKEFEPVSSWVAHLGGRVTHMVERRGYLVTLGVSFLTSSVCSA